MTFPWRLRRGPSSPTRFAERPFEAEDGQMTTLDQIIAKISVLNDEVELLKRRTPIDPRAALWENAKL